MRNLYKYLTTNILVIILTAMAMLTGLESYAQKGHEEENLRKLKQQAEEYNANGEIQKLAQTLSKMGYIYASIKHNDEAIKAYQKSASLYLQKQKLDDARKAYSNIGFIYTDDDDFTNALTYFNKALKTAELTRKELPIAGCKTDVAYILMQKKEYLKAIDRLLEALELAQSIDNKPMIQKIYAMLMECYKALGMNNKFQEFQSKLNNLSTHIQRESVRQEVEDLQIKNTADKERSDLEARAHELEMQLAERDKEDRERAIKDERKRREADSLAQQRDKEQLAREKELAEKEKEISEQRLRAQEAKQKTLTLIITGGLLFLLLLLLLLYLLWRSTRKTKKLNANLQEKNDVIEDQNKMLEDWGKELQVAYEEVSNQKQSISDSIHYAEHIQRSMLPHPALIKKTMPKCMVFFRPRDVVSGDFYWFYQKDHKTYLAAIDCTGHGVPGAMISMIGYNVLENIMSNTKFIHPNEIMDQMHMDIRRVLRQDTTDNHDGMDMALCMINHNTKTVEYCGAKNSMVICRTGQEPLKVKPDPFGVGGLVPDDPENPNPTGARRFSNNKFADVDNDTTFYIFSDGYSDQFGGDKDKKYMLGNFRRLLSEAATHPLDEQEQFLQNDLNAWKNGREQTDDILIIAFKV